MAFCVSLIEGKKREPSIKIQSKFQKNRGEPKTLFY